MNGELVRRARMRMGMSREDLAEVVGVDSSTIQRWEAGDHEPHDRNVQRLREVLCINLDDLMGHEDRPRSAKNQAPNFPVAQAVLRQNLAPRLEYLARHPDYNSLRVQYEITQAIEEHMRMQTNEYAVMSRRDALQNLAAFFALFSGRGVKIAPEETNKLCAAGITASGYLSRGNHEDMKLASSMIVHYLPALKDVASSSSKHRSMAIGLISQAFQMKAIVGAHLEGTKASVNYARQAVQYANMTDDIVLRVVAARELANRYRQGSSYDQALAIAEEGNAHLESLSDEERDELVPPFLQSWFYAGFGSYSAHGHKSKKQQALTALAKARETFAAPLDGQNLPGFINHCETNLINNEGITYAALGEPDTGLAAFERFLDFEHDRLFARLPTAQRTHVGSIIDAIFISLKLPKQKKDKALSIKLWKAGIEGAKTLHSEKFFHEAVTAYQIMESIWSDESDVQDLRDLIKKDW